MLPAVTEPVVHENGREDRHVTSPPSEDVYDDIGDVIDDVTKDEAPALLYDVIEEVDENAERDQQGAAAYDDLQQSTRDYNAQQSSVYQHILPEAPASAAAGSTGIGQDQQDLYLQLIGDEQHLSRGREIKLTKTFYHKGHKNAVITTDSAPAARAYTMWLNTASLNRTKVLCF